MKSVKIEERQKQSGAVLTLLILHHRWANGDTPVTHIHSHHSSWQVFRQSSSLVRLLGSDKAALATGHWGLGMSDSHFLDFSTSPGCIHFLPCTPGPAVVALG